MMNKIADRRHLSCKIVIELCPYRIQQIGLYNAKSGFSESMRLILVANINLIKVYF